MLALVMMHNQALAPYSLCTDARNAQHRNLECSLTGVISVQRRHVLTCCGHCGYSKTALHSCGVVEHVSLRLASPEI